MFVLAIEGLEGELQKAAELKAQHKSTLLKLASQRASQRVYPTFDINPQIVKDFLDKAAAHEGGLPPNGVFFESCQEYQSSVEGMGQPQNTAEPPSDRPASFAQALLSKLNVSADNAIASPTPTRHTHRRAISSISSIRSESQGPSRGSSPAKLDHSARKDASPSGVPPTRNGDTEGLQNGVSATTDCTGPLLSYMRSLRQNDHKTPMVTGSVALLSDDPVILGAAREANIPTKSICEIRNISAEVREAEKQRSRDRDILGEVDTLMATVGPAGTNGVATALRDETDVEEEKFARRKELSQNVTVFEDKQNALGEDVTKGNDQIVEFGDGESEKVGAVPRGTTLPGTVEDIVLGTVNGILGTLDGTLEKKEHTPPADIAPEEMKTTLAVPARLQDEIASHQEASPEPTAPKSSPSPAMAPSVEDSSSDDEVVVFNPRSKRLSQTKASLQPPKAPQVPKVPSQYNVASNGGPALIDPDAFGRTFARKPSGVALNAGRTLATRSPRASPRHSPHRSIATPEPADVDFVLKSGSPRGAARGKGKLWVP